jgi:hypothetical protein
VLLQVPAGAGRLRGVAGGTEVLLQSWVHSHPRLQKGHQQKSRLSDGVMRSETLYAQGMFKECIETDSIETKTAWLLN